MTVYEQIVSLLPFEAKAPSISRNAYISKATNNCLEYAYTKMVETIKNFNNYIVKSKNKDYRIFPYLNARNYKFHASATKINDNLGAISLSAGVYFAIADACSTLVHREDFLPELLGSPKEYVHCSCPECGGRKSMNGWLHDYTWLGNENPDEAPNWIPLKASKYPTPRSSIGNYLIMRCLYWICAHEVGHLLLNHNEILGKKTYSESENDISNEELNLYHVMEIEADSFATFLDTNFVNNCISINKQFKYLENNSAYSGDWQYIDEKTVLKLLILVPSIISMILSQVNSSYSDTHPSPAQRFLFQKFSFEIFFKKRQQLDFLPILSEAEKYFDSIVDNCMLDEFEKLKWTLEKYNPKGFELIKHKSKFESLYGSWEDRLMKKGLFEIYNSQ